MFLRLLRSILPHSPTVPSPQWKPIRFSMMPTAEPARRPRRPKRRVFRLYYLTYSRPVQDIPFSDGAETAMRSMPITAPGTVISSIYPRPCTPYGESMNIQSVMTQTGAAARRQRRPKHRGFRLYYLTYSRPVQDIPFSDGAETAMRSMPITVPGIVI